MKSSLKNSLEKIRPVIKKINAYHVPDAEGLIKLDAMENPYALPADLINALQVKLSSAELNRYPDPSARKLREKLRSVMQVPDDRGVLLGNGSDELIQMLAMAIANHESDDPTNKNQANKNQANKNKTNEKTKKVCLMSFDPGFVMYKMISDFVGVEYIGVPLQDDFSLDMDATRRAIEKHQPEIIFIAYPNNPSANCYNENEIEEIISIAPGMVVLDEAYHPFAQKNFMNRLSEFDHLLVMRTVSKMGLAGLRLGILCGHPEIIAEIDKIRLPYNINVLTQVAAELVLDNVSVLDEQAKKIREEREVLLKTMADISGLEVFPSHANFILFRVTNNNANEVFESIKSSGVLIKNMRADEGLLKNCLRVTVGAPDENKAFVSALLLAMKG